MIKVVDTLNTFAQNGQQGIVQPSEEQIFVLTSNQLQDLIYKVHELKETLLEGQERQDLLEDKVIALQNENDALKRELEKLAENQLIQLRLINELRTKKEPSGSPLIDELYDHMMAVGLKQTTFAGASKILKVTKMRVLQLHGAIALDQRFIIIPSKSHKQKLLIRLKEFYQEV